MTTRRSFLQTAAIGATGAGFLPTGLSAAPTPSTRNSPGAAQGGEVGGAVSTRHRNLFNGDSCVFFYNPEIYLPENFRLEPIPEQPVPGGTASMAVKGGPFTAKAIHRFVDVLADNGMDTFLVNANASRAWYPSKTIPTILDGYRRGDREYFRGHALCQGATTREEEEQFIDRIMPFMNLYQDLLDAKVDWLAEAAVACRRRRISPWVSIRMNDLHGHRNWEGSFFNLPLLKNPEMRLKRSVYSPTMRDPSYRSGLNYERAEVRAIMLEQIREVVEDYDYEGLELDWLRNPLCCEPNASAETVAMMSDWIRQVRAITERQAKKLGRPYPLGLRIPGKLEVLRSIGLDVATLCREGTLDFVSPSGFWCTTWEMPHDALRRELGDRVTIYGVIEDGVNPLAAFSPQHKSTQRLRYLSSSREHMRANAAGKLVLGANGLEWFNFFCTDQARVPGVISDYEGTRGLTRLEPLRGLPKHYALSTWADFFTHIPFEPVPQLPVNLEPKWLHPFRLPMCAEPTDRGLELVVQVVLKAGQKPNYMPVAINGGWPNIENTETEKLLMPCGSLTHHVPAHHGYNYRFPVSVIRDGWNEISVENGSPEAFTIVSLEVAVRPIGGAES